MTKNEVIKLMENIKTFYHNFSYPPDLVDAWHDRLQHMTYEQAKKNLDAYIDTDELGRTPTIAKILRYSSSGNVDEWIDYRKNLILAYYDKDTFIDQNGMLWAYPSAE